MEARSPQSLHNFHLKALLRLPKAHLLAIRAVAKSDYVSLVGIPENHSIGNEVRARCARGILIFWALVDIQQSVCPPSSRSSLKYTPAPAPAPVLTVRSKNHPRQRRQGIVMRLLRPLSRKSTLDPPSMPSIPAKVASTAQDITTDSKSTTQNALNGVPAQTSISASDTKRRLEAIKTAQEPFVVLLSRTARVDLELAQGYLHWLMPFDMSGCFGGPSLEYKERCWWKESWALRQGPAFILSICSRDEKERAWALRRMEEEWKARTKDVIEVERTTPIFLFRDGEMNKEPGLKPLWSEAWDLREEAMHAYAAAVDPAR